MYSLYTLVSYADGKCLAGRSNLNRCLARIALQIGCKRHRVPSHGVCPPVSTGVYRQRMEGVFIKAKQQ